MPGIALPIKETNLLRSRLQNLLRLREAYLQAPGPDTIHDLRVASRRAREVLDYMQPLLSPKWYSRLTGLARRVTKRLGRLRETEVNLDLLKKWHEQQKIDATVSELLIFSLTQDFERMDVKARNGIESPEFSQIAKFLERLHGTRSQASTNSSLLELRNQEFLSFSWEGVMNDQRLHDLRIRAKKFRYAMEIYDRLHNRNQGRFTRRIRNLQDVLGRLHDLYVLAESIRMEKIKWDAAGLELIPEALKKTYEFVAEEKNKLYPRVLPLYSRILETSPFLQVGPPPMATAV